jgi:hypothetical protein
MESEQTHLRELQKIEQEISRQRISSLNSLESTAAEEMELMDHITKEAEKILQDGEAHLSRKMELTLNIQKHRELAEAAEAITHDKLNKLHMRRARDEVCNRIEGMRCTLTFLIFIFFTFPPLHL